MASVESRKRVAGQAGETTVAQASERPSAGVEGGARVSPPGGGARTRALRKVKIALVLATAGIMLFMVARPGDARLVGAGQDGGEGRQTVADEPLTAEAQ